MTTKHELVQQVEWDESARAFTIVETGKPYCRICKAVWPEHPHQMTAKPLDEWDYHCPGPRKLSVVRPEDRAVLEAAEQDLEALRREFLEMAEEYLRLRAWSRKVAGVAPKSDFTDEVLEHRIKRERAHLQTRPNLLPLREGRWLSESDEIAWRTRGRMDPAEGKEALDAIDEDADGKDARPMTEAERDYARRIQLVTDQILPRLAPVRPLPPWRKR